MRQGGEQQLETMELIGIIVLIVGFVLIAVELVVPGFGLPGIGGIVCLVSGVFLITDSTEEGILVTIAVIVILCILTAVIMGLMHYRKFKSPIILDADVHFENAQLQASDLDYLLHREGTASTDLRPVGKGNFDGIELDIVSDGVYIKKGSRIRINKISANRLMVSEAEKRNN